jgi:flagellar biosynthesis protein FliR
LVFQGLLLKENMMKTTLLKIILLVAYCTSLSLVWTAPEFSAGFVPLLLKFFLAYCGIIVVFQLIAEGEAVLRSWAVLLQHNRQQLQGEPRVIFETESEAT